MRRPARHSQCVDSTMTKCLGVVESFANIFSSDERPIAGRLSTIRQRHEDAKIGAGKDLEQEETEGTEGTEGTEKSIDSSLSYSVHSVTSCSMSSSSWCLRAFVVNIPTGLMCLRA